MNRMVASISLAVAFAAGCGVSYLMRPAQAAVGTGARLQQQAAEAAAEHGGAYDCSELRGVCAVASWRPKIFFD